MKVYVNIKQIGKKKSKIEKKEYEIKNKIENVKELITEFITINVENFNNRAMEDDIVPYLTADKIKDNVEIGKVSFGVNYNENRQDLEKAIENVLQSYEDGIYRIFLNDDELGEKLESEVKLRENDELTFVRLTMLAGRMF